MVRKDDLFPLAALATLAGVTALWWAFALWPLPSDAPVWLERARFVCFNTGESGLPQRSGWILLVGQPLGMVALLMAGWGERTAGALGRLAATRTGRGVLAATVLVSVAGAVATGVRVADAVTPETGLPEVAHVPDTYPRLDLPWPVAHGLVDQAGAPFDLASLGGRPALVTFAYAHCETICPLLVRSAQEARSELEDGDGWVLVALTLDPWRDTPARLPALAERWSLREGDFVVSGEVAAVEAALDGWNVPRERDARTGDLSHPALTFLVAADGRVAYATSGGVAQLVALASRIH